MSSSGEDMLSALSNIAETVNGPILFITAISVFFLVGITVVMVYFTFRYSRRRNPEPEDVHGNTILEVVWTVIPTLLAFGMFWYGWVGYQFMKNVPEDAYEVNVTGRMWSWLYEYENGVQSDVLNIPIGRPIRLNLKSRDVIHSFYIPAFKVKQDVVPGVDGLFLWFTAKEIGEYDVFCAEYCGLQHSAMLSKVVVMPETEFDEWLSKKGEEVKEMQASLEEGGEEEGSLATLGQRLATTKGCIACHSSDGSRLVGPSFKALFGTTQNVVSDGVEREVTVDDDYVRKSILEPKADIVKGYQPLMPSQRGLVTDDEIDAIIAYIKSLK
jgi:cytochrome c oxidase subunit 2